MKNMIDQNGIQVAKSFDFSVLSDFCAARNRGNALKNGNQPTSRVNWITNFLDKLGLEYELFSWEHEISSFFMHSSSSLSSYLGNKNMVLSNPNGSRNSEDLQEAVDWAFDSFPDITLDELKIELKRFEDENFSTIWKKLANVMIKIKKDQEKRNNSSGTTMLYNIYIHGYGNKAVMAHHDIVNPNSDNAMDNSASVINAIATHIYDPSVTVLITDGEEVGGLGSQKASDHINEGRFGDLEWVLNFELTAAGGKSFFIEDHRNSNLYEHIKSIFPDCKTEFTPFHDGIILRRNNIDSIVINPLPKLPDGSLDMKILGVCHSSRDTLELANYQDMKEFVEEVVIPIVSQ